MYSLRKSILNAIVASSLKLILILTPALPTSHIYAQKKKVPYKKPTVTEIETSIFELVNKARIERSIPPLRLSKELRSLARKHSKDMASHEKLSHLSTSGKTYTERLLEEGFYFISHGENVASSDSFLAKFFHQKLMESTEHRENILEPDFDTVGIGIILKEGKDYYVTQDFLKSFEPKGEKEIKKDIQEIINEVRAKNSLLPLVYREEADKFARILSERKAKQLPLPSFPASFGETHATFITTPTISEANYVLEEIISSIYEQGGLGIWIGKNKKYPGGAYFITLLLFPKNIYKNMSEEELREIVFQEMNKTREKNGLNYLYQDEGLSYAASKITLLIMSGKNKQFAIPPHLRINIISYITEGPYMLPTELQEKMENAKFKKIGIGILFGMTPKFPRGAFWITIIFEE
jgi:uncharacterized protein YkwD